MNTSIETISYDWCLGKPCGKICRLGIKYTGLCTLTILDIVRHFRLQNIIQKKRRVKQPKSMPLNGVKQMGFIRTKSVDFPMVYWDCKNPDFHQNNLNTPTKNTLKSKSTTITQCLSILRIYILSKRILSVKAEVVIRMQNITRLCLLKEHAKIKNGKKMIESFHKFLTGNSMTDHVNRNPMDNRRCNLRATTKKSEQQQSTV